ncbi:MAG: S1 family peptidase [Pseudonocardiaceae bacterium]
MTPYSDDLWRVRIRCGESVGAGFAVAGGFVLTCAHVVEDGTDPMVELPSTRERWSGRIVFYDKTWHESKKPWADVAVIALPNDGTLSPAPLGPLDPQPQRGARLEVFGFPANYAGQEDRGQRTQVQVVGMDEFGKSLQVNGSSEHDGRVIDGYSGSAATDVRSGRVVGMVTQADRDPTARISWVIPLATISESWPALGNRLPTAFEVDPDVISAIDDLDCRRYREALNRLNGLINLYRAEADMYYYRALAGLDGTRPGHYSIDMILAVEQLLWHAWKLAQPTKRAHIGALWALVREDYYLMRGLKQSSPDLAELRHVARGLSDQHSDELWSHVPAYECRTWRELNDRIQARGRPPYE